MILLRTKESRGACIFSFLGVRGGLHLQRCNVLTLLHCSLWSQGEDDETNMTTIAMASPSSDGLQPTLLQLSLQHPRRANPGVQVFPKTKSACSAASARAVVELLEEP